MKTTPLIVLNALNDEELARLEVPSDFARAATHNQLLEFLKNSEILTGYIAIQRCPVLDQPTQDIDQVILYVGKVG